MSVTPVSRWDHPRIRGEHKQVAISVNTFEGSSPHTRGALGKIPRLSRISVDHPRIRGEHEAEFTGIGGPSGSSPHTRGAPHAAAGDQVGDGIIPAYAGSTIEDRLPSRQVRDHPRIRGEHVILKNHVEELLGSSPHTRGALRWPQENYLPARIIPAYAGSTLAIVWRACASADHPRIRGEHLDHRHPPGAGAGSSPHTRGARDGSHSPCLCHGIIPAYAGSTTAAPIK